MFTIIDSINIFYMNLLLTRCSQFDTIFSTLIQSTYDSVIYIYKIKSKTTCGLSFTNKSATMITCSKMYCSHYFPTSFNKLIISCGVCASANLATFETSLQYKAICDNRFKCSLPK